MSKFFHRRYFVAAIVVAVFALGCLPPEIVFAQEEGENPNSPPIDMVINPGTVEEMWQTSHDGLLDPVGMYPLGQMAIVLSARSLNPRDPVGIAPLDGGEIFADKDLQVADDLEDLEFLHYWGIEMLSCKTRESSGICPMRTVGARRTER